MGLSLRVYCYDPSGQLYSVPETVASAMIGVAVGKGVAIPRFASCTVRFAQFIVELQDRKPVSVSMENYYVLRFDSNGVADSERYLRETLEMRDSLFGDKMVAGVIDARGIFATRGRGWSPTPTEKIKLNQAVFGEVKVPRLPKLALRATDARIWQAT